MGSAAVSRARRYPPPAKPEPFWPPILTTLVAISLQVVLPDRLTAGPSWVVPALEGALLIGLTIVTPRTMEREHPVRRTLAIGLTALVSAANIYSLVELTSYLLSHGTGVNGKDLLVSGALVWLTNFLIFGLWYWEMDRGGPGRRASGDDGPPDFLFTQMNDDSIFPPNWRPSFIDYLYVALTNAVAVSPTDTMPLTALAKSAMGVQSLVSLVTVTMIISFAVGLLG